MTHPFLLPPNRLYAAAQAALLDNLDAAVARCQNELGGVKSGDVAGMFFSGVTQADWLHMVIAERQRWLIAYMWMEVLYASDK